MKKDFEFTYEEAKQDEKAKEVFRTIAELLNIMAEKAGDQSGDPHYPYKPEELSLGIQFDDEKWLRFGEGFEQLKHKSRNIKEEVQE